MRMVSFLPCGDGHWLPLWVYSGGGVLVVLPLWVYSPRGVCFRGWGAGGSPPLSVFTPWDVFQRVGCWWFSPSECIHPVGCVSGGGVLVVLPLWVYLPRGMCFSGWGAGGSPPLSVFTPWDVFQRVGCWWFSPSECIYPVGCVSAGGCWWFSPSECIYPVGCVSAGGVLVVLPLWVYLPRGVCFSGWGAGGSPPLSVFTPWDVFQRVGRWWFSPSECIHPVGCVSGGGVLVVLPLWVYSPRGMCFSGWGAGGSPPLSVFTPWGVFQRVGRWWFSPSECIHPVGCVSGGGVLVVLPLWVYSPRGVCFRGWGAGGSPPLSVFTPWDVFQGVGCWWFSPSECIYPVGCVSAGGAMVVLPLWVYLPRGVCFRGWGAGGSPPLSVFTPWDVFQGVGCWWFSPSECIHPVGCVSAGGAMVVLPLWVYSPRGVCFRGWGAGGSPPLSVFTPWGVFQGVGCWWFSPSECIHPVGCVSAGGAMVVLPLWVYSPRGMCFSGWGDGGSPPLSVFRGWGDGGSPPLSVFTPWGVFQRVGRWWFSPSECIHPVGCVSGGGVLVVLPLWVYLPRGVCFSGWGAGSSPPLSVFTPWDVFQRVGCWWFSPSECIHPVGCVSAGGVLVVLPLWVY